MDCFTAQIRVEFAAISPIVGKIFFSKESPYQEFSLNMKSNKKPVLLKICPFLGEVLCIHPFFPETACISTFYQKLVTGLPPVLVRYKSASSPVTIHLPFTSHCPIIYQPFYPHSHPIYSPFNT